MPLPGRIGVIGGGRMGAGIAQVFAQAGSAVVIIEQDAEAAAAALARVDDGVVKAIRHSPSIDRATVLNRVAASDDYEQLAGADLVVEAVPEVIELKHAALARAERIVGSAGWLATNTSSIPVTRLAEQLERPEQFGGLHFFNPVPPSSLVEIVIAARTSAAFRNAALDWVVALGKTPIVVNDAPGFASSRLGNALALEAMRMLEEGVASASDIDAAMVLGYRHATGPLRTSDIVGLDVRLRIAEQLAADLGERFEPPQILRDLVAAGHLGRKSGKGFFEYTAE